MEIKKTKKAVFNWSGGKDSALALKKALDSGEYEIKSLLTTVNGDSRRSTMHAIPESLLKAQARSIGLPLHIVELAPDGEMAGYNEAMRKTVNFFKAEGITHFIFGDIFLHDVRSYREQQLAPYGIEVVEPLWDRTSEEVMEEFIASGLKTVIITTMADKLGRDYIGKTINENLVKSFPDDIDICGENGEYHTFCCDGPIFTSPVSYRLGKPFQFSHEVGMDDGSRQTFTYWFANIAE